MQMLCVGRNKAELSRRAAAIGRDVDDLRKHGLAGTPAEVVEPAAAFGAVGATRLYLQVLDLVDLDHLGFVVSEVMPHLVGPQPSEPKHTAGGVVRHQRATARLRG